MADRYGSRAFTWVRWRSALVFSVVLVLGGGARLLASGDPCGGEGIEDLDPGDSQTFSIPEGCPARQFTINVPAHATLLTITTTGGSGNGDLYVKQGSAASPTSNDYASAGPGNVERVEVGSPGAGTWYVTVNPNPSTTDITLAVNVQAQSPELEDGHPLDDLGDDVDGDFTYFSVQVPPGSAELIVTTANGTGNSDLLVRPQYLPTLTSPNTVRSLTPTTADSVSIPSPQGGPWKIGLYAQSPYAGVTLTVTIVPGGSCVASDTSLCSLGGRFSVSVTWINQHAGNQSGVGHVVPGGSDQTGYFWFFDPANTELVVKVLDGRGVNGHFWVFFGGLSDVDFTVRVADSVSPQVRTYHHPPGSLSGFADTSAF